MIFKLIITFSILTLLFLTPHSAIGQGETGGYIQELFMFEDSPDDNSTTEGAAVFAFRKQVPDLTFCFGTATRFCTRGFWMAYMNTHFEGPVINLHGYSEDLACFEQAELFPFKSIRHAVNLTTSTTAMSLYSQEGYQGPEILVTEIEFGLLDAKSFLYTGSTEWLLFEHQNFEGKSVCTEFNADFAGLGIYGHVNVTESLKLEQIGSVMQGCNHPPETLKRLRLGRKSSSN